MKGKFEKITKIIPENCDGILLTSEVNQFYACDFPFTDGYVLVMRDKTYLISDPRYYEASLSSEGVEKVELKRGVLEDLFSSLNIKSLAYEDQELKVADLHWLEGRFPDIAFHPIGGALSDLREYKDEDELEKIKTAQSIADRAFEHILGFISTDRTEKEVALELEFYMRSHGAENVAFETIAVSGQATSLPHGVPRDVKVNKGFLTMDFGCKYHGYCSDMTRTVVVGKATDEMKKLYNTVLKAQTAAIEATAFGMKCSDLDAVARDIIDAEPEFKGAFSHSLGHGVGLYIHEMPGVSYYNDGKVLSAGHVITIEPGIYLFGKYGCRIEDMMVFHKDRVENITHSRKELIEI